MDLSKKIPVLNKGYVKYIGHMGSDEEAIRAARMSSGKDFYGWYWEEDTYANAVCASCKTQQLWEALPEIEDDDLYKGCKLCMDCWEPQVYHFNMIDTRTDYPEFMKELKPKLLGKKGAERDLALLTFLYVNKHLTPFEMAGELAIEVYLPLVVRSEWQRHRTQSYNELSGRYAKMPNDHYVPELDRIQKQSKTNKQGSGESLSENEAKRISRSMYAQQRDIYLEYNEYLRRGVAKEVARLNTPLSRYTKMRAKTDVRNWLAFLFLRMEKTAQWEMREYANVIAQIIQHLWPKTFALFMEHDFLGERFSRTEMKLLRNLLNTYGEDERDLQYAMSEFGVDPEGKFGRTFLAKFQGKEDSYKDVLKKLGMK